MLGEIVVSLNERAALLVIDVQEGFCNPSWGPRNNPEAESNIGQLLAVWRETGRPVVHVHHESASPEESFFPSTRGNEPKTVA